MLLTPKNQERIRVGKVVGRTTYIYVDAIGTGLDIDTSLADRLAETEVLAGVRRGENFNLMRVDAATGEIALLNYPGFFDEAFPELAASWRLDPISGVVTHRTYAGSLNPPILHRKELLLPEDDPRRVGYAALTAACESIGLFNDPRRIGYKSQWEQLVREKGYRITGHELVPIGNDESGENTAGEDQGPLHAGWEAARHLTALVRYGFSAPVQTLARYGFLDGSNTLFDYGCGRGNDVRGLVENGITASGWDPYHAPDNPIASADIVNLGFVVNVIEDFDERLDALTRAFSLAERLLVVSVMLSNQNDVPGQRFRDGVMTRRGTFQKYYTQAEIKAFLEAALDEEPIPVAPGVLYVFRDKDAEQCFLVDRYRSRRNLLRSPAAPAREQVTRPRHDRADERYQTYREPLERLWERWVTLGRAPDKTEVEDLISLTEGFGTLGKALRFIERRGDRDLGEVERSRDARIADLEVYFALNQFERRKPYKHLERGLQRDIKEFFGDYRGAQSEGFALLTRIADVEGIEQACRHAAEHGLGWLELRDAVSPPAAEVDLQRQEHDVPESGKSLQLHASLVEQLPPLLRIYVGCAAVLYGDYRNADLVKIHIGSGKVSLIRYDDFEGKALPRMIERVKIKLREQDIDYFAYEEDYEPPFLYHKSRYINEEFPNYPEQVVFEKALEGLGLFDLSGYGPRPDELLKTLANNRLAVNGFELVRAKDIPGLDDPCGRYLTFRQVIECGETQARTSIPNLPKQPESYNALYDLAVGVLDPVIDYFGMIRPTYGFCSPELAKEIPGRIDPKRDQHAAHELNRRGNAVCPRLGAAVDFVVEDESMLEVAQWIVTNTPFDRLYFYGDDKPIHVSFGPDDSRQVVRMVAGKSSKLVPRVTSREMFLALS